MTCLGNIYYYWGRYRKAGESYEKPPEISKKMGAVHEEGGALHNLRMVYATQGKYTEALTNFHKVLDIC